MGMSELPNNWAWSTVGALADYIQRGKSPKYAETSELPVINQKCIRWNELQLQHLKYVHPDQVSAWDESRYIRSGDILWNSTGTGTVGRAHLVKEADCVPAKVVDSHVTIVRATPGLEPRYLFNWIKSPAVQNKIEEMCDGTTNQIELSRTAIAATAIPVAPREEQTRIADQLDTLLARIKACNDHLDAIPGLLKRFRQAAVSAAMAGELTAEWSGSTPAQAWSIDELQALCEPKRVITYGVVKLGEENTGRHALPPHKQCPLAQVRARWHEENCVGSVCSIWENRTERGRNPCQRTWHLGWCCRRYTKDAWLECLSRGCRRSSRC
jgi:hypothetical protein